MVDRRTAFSAVLGTIAGMTMPEEAHAEVKEEKKIFGYVLQRTYDTGGQPLYQFFKNDEIHRILKANVKIQMENPKDVDVPILSSWVEVSAKEAAEDAAIHFEYYKIKTEIIPVYKD